MQELRTLVIHGIRGSAPRSQNIIKIFEIQQGEKETPMALLWRLRNQMRKYSGLDPEDPVGRVP